MLHTSCLADQVEGVLEFKYLASGIMAIPVNPERGEYLIRFRPEVPETVNWGGNPFEAVNPDPDKKKLSSEKLF